MSVADVKTLLTVPEAAKALRIGRSTAYELAHAWLDSAGSKGLPVVVIGGSLRVPVAAIERLFAIGGFGPAWDSGLDRRRRTRGPLRAGCDETTEAHRRMDHDIAEDEPGRVPRRPRRSVTGPPAPVQLSLFDAHAEA